MQPSSSSLPLPLTSAILLLLVTLTTTPTLTLASITCASPTSGTTVNPGNSLTLQWGDSGSFPKSGDVYSADATISCSGGSGSQIAKVEGISNGQSWTVPGNVLDTCGGDGGLEVTLSGTNYDMLHLTHWSSFNAQCGSVEVQPVPVAATTTTTTTTTTATTTTNAAPVTTATTDPATTPMPTLSTAIPTISVTPTVSGTISGVPPPVAPGANPVVTGLNPNNPSSPSSTSSTSSDSSDSSDSSSESGNSSSKSGDPSSKSGGPSKAALGALGAIGGLAAIAVLIFGFVLIKRRQRQRAREERWMDHNYSSTAMSDHKGPGSFNGGGNGYSFSGPGAGATASSVSNPHLQSTEYVIPQPAPPADQNDNDNDKQPEMSTVPVRPARTYQGDFDDSTTPWDGQLGYLQPFPSQQASIIIGAGAGENMDLGYEYIQDYIPSNPTYQHDDTNNNNRQLSMRASSQFPEDLEYFARLRETSWPMRPISPDTSSLPTLTTVDGLDCDIRTTAIQQPHSDAVPDPSS